MALYAGNFTDEFKHILSLLKFNVEFGLKYKVVPIYHIQQFENKILDLCLINLLIIWLINILD